MLYFSPLAPGELAESSFEVGSFAKAPAMVLSIMIWLVLPVLAQACNMLCADCVAGTCRACVDGAAIDPVSSECVCGINLYQDGNQCSSCHYTCAKCSRQGEGYCMSCFVNYGIFGSPPGKCERCSPICYHCSSSLKTSCSECFPYAERIEDRDSECVCMANAFTLTDSSQCQPCHPTCATCKNANTATDCLSCLANATLDPSGACLCNDGYARNPTECLPCDGSCLTCTLPADSTKCSTCKGLATVTSPPSSCVCQSSYFPNPTPETCSLCSTECLTCVGALNTQCMSCKTHTHLATSPGPAACLCDAQLFPDPDALNCSSCDASCESCISATVCVSCTPPSYLSPFTLLCVCNEHEYASPTPRNCLSCSALCATCSAGTAADCLSCWVNAHLLAGACVCDDGFFPSPDVSSCVSCHSACKTCSGGTAGDCLSCGTNALPSGSTCVCSGGFYFPIGLTDCVACDTTCLTCYSGSASSCNSCFANASVTSVVGYGSCACVDGYYPNPTVTDCALCDVTCQTCSNSSTCTSCKLGAQLSGSTCVCVDGYYGTADNCQACHSVCFKCIGPLQTDCWHCAYPAGSCSSGSSTCLDCHASCVKCSGRTASHCTSCYPNATLNGGPKSECVCDDGFYPNPGAENCTACHSLCRTCSGGTPALCTGCHSNATLKTVVAPDFCVCVLGYYADPDSAHCSSCSACVPCATVVPTQCLPCCATVSGDPSTPQCNDGYYPTSALATCSLCYLACKTCDGGTATDCLSCFANATLQSRSCLCDVHYFPNPAANTCTPCHATCYSCTGTSANNCLSCYGEAIVAASTCECKVGYYPNTTSANCQLCHITCRGCSAFTVCTSCKSIATLSSGACICPDGYYMNSVGECSLCNSNCKTCTGSPTTCTSCFDGMWINSSVCVPCINNCATCLNATHCYSCVPIALLVGTACLPCTSPCATCSHGSQSYCDSCVDGYYLTSPNCLPCASLCARCSVSATNCSACAPGYLMIGTLCTVCTSPCATCILTLTTCTSCVPGYVLEGTRCVPCQYPCATCQVTAIDCLSCVSGYYLQLQRCLLCNSPCASCTGTADSCLSCVPGYLLSGNTCPLCPSPCRTCTALGCDSCKDGYFMMSGVCTPCAFPCKTCYKTASTCLSCVDTYYLEGTTCKGCAESCGGCSGPSTCLSCPSNFILVESKCVPYCSETCQTCSRPLPDYCTACKAHAHPKAGVFPSACLCDSGYYMGAAQWDCHLCHFSCKICTSASPLYCSECAGLFNLAMLYCEDYCPLNYYRDEGSCVLEAESALIFALTFSSIHTPFKDSAAGYVCEANAGFVSYQKGIQLAGDQYVKLPPNSLDSRDVTLPSSFYAELWIRPNLGTGLQCLLSKSIGSTKVLSVCLLDDILQLNILLYSDSTTAIGSSERLFESALALHSVLLGGSLGHTWSDVLVTVETSKPTTTYQTILSIFVNGMLRAESLVKASFFRDFNSADGSVEFKLGGFAGAFAELLIGTGSRSMHSCACVQCTTLGMCLSDCRALEYSDTCQACSSTCTHGCMRGGDCVLSTDPLCAAASDFGVCTQCKELSELKVGACQCTKYAVAMNSICQCSQEYQNVNGVCESCANFVMSAKLNSAGNYLILDFSKSMNPATLTQCAQIFPSVTLAKLGADPSCVWPTESRLAVALGVGRTLKAETIQLFGLVGSCSNSSALAAVQFIAEKPAVVISAPQTFSLACKSVLILSALSSTGFDYSWTLKGAGLSEKILQGEEVALSFSDLSEGTLSAVLTVRNYAGLQTSAERSVRITSKQELSLTIGGGENVSMLSSETREFVVNVMNECGQGDYQFNWDFVKAEPSLPQSVDIPKLLATARGNSLLASGGTLRPGVTYTMQCTATLGTVSGSVMLRLTVLSSSLKVICDREDGPFSTATALRVDCSASTDPDDPMPVVAQWTWKQSPLQPGTLLEFNPSLLVLSLPPNVLQPGTTYTFTLTVRKNSRSAQKAISFSVLNQGSFKAINRFSQTRVSNQRPLKIIPEVFSAAEMSPSWSWLGTFSLEFCSSTTLPFICVLPRTEGFGYKLQLSLVSQATLRFEFQVNMPPRNGKLAVTPAAGNSRETYRLLASGWEDTDGPDLPILYSFGYSAAELFSLPQLCPAFTTMLRSGAYSVVTKVCDSLDSCATASAPVSISASRALSSAEFEDVYSSLIRIPQQTLAACTTLLATSEVDANIWTLVLTNTAKYAQNLREIRNSDLQTFLPCYSQLARSASCDFSRISEHLLDAILSLREELQDASFSGLITALEPCPIRTDEDAISAQQFYRTIENQYLESSLPDQLPFIKSNANFFAYVRKAMGGTMIDGVLVQANRLKVDVPPSFLRDIGVRSSQVVNVRVNYLREPSFAAGVVFLDLEAAGSYVSYTYAPSAPAHIPVANLSTPIELTLPLFNISGGQYTCVRVDSRVEVADCSVVGVNSSAVLLHAREFGMLTAVPVQFRFPSVSQLPESSSQSCDSFFGPTFAIIALVQAVVLAGVLIWWKTPVPQTEEGDSPQSTSRTNSPDVFILSKIEQSVVKPNITVAPEILSLNSEGVDVASSRISSTERLLDGHYLFSVFHLKSQQSLFSLFLALESHLAFLGILVYLHVTPGGALCAAAAMTTVLSLALTMLYSVSDRMESVMLRRLVTVCSRVYALALLVLVIALNQAVCSTEAKTWMTNFLYCAAGEVTVLETLVASFRYGFLKFSRNSRPRITL